MGILAVTDLHLTDNATEEYRHEFMFTHLTEIVRNRRPEVVAILGDLTEEKDRHRGRLVNRVAAHIDVLASYCPVLVLMGNHDYANEGFPFFDFLHRFPQVEFVERVKHGHELSKPFRKAFKDCLFLPHTRDFERDWQGLKFKDQRAVFSHNTYENAGTEHGSRLKGIPLDLVEGARVYAGDVHTPQTTGPVTYIGAPYTVDFGDTYKPRLLWLEGEKASWIDVSKYPQKVLIHCVEGEDLEDHRKAFGKGDLLKVRVDVDTIQGWREIVDVVHRQAEKYGAKALKVEPVVLNRSKRKSIKVESGSHQSDKAIVQAYADRHKLDDATLHMGLDLLED